jgi:hypothetical protein
MGAKPTGRRTLHVFALPADSGRDGFEGGQSEFSAVVCNPIRKRVGSYTPSEMTTRRCALKMLLLGNLSIGTPRGAAVHLMTSVGDKGVGLIKEDQRG